MSRKAACLGLLQFDMEVMSAQDALNSECKCMIEWIDWRLLLVHCLTALALSRIRKASHGG